MVSFASRAPGADQVGDHEQQRLLQGLVSSGVALPVAKSDHPTTARE
ncbi:MAG TPA: hypothetical protein VHR45_12000 [Thermoanaerobaculia bacterium]|nr:hypothetical protein [Thermoanaerobaculia bacterium]